MTHLMYIASFKYLSLLYKLHLISWQTLDKIDNKVWNNYVDNTRYHTKK